MPEFGATEIAQIVVLTVFFVALFSVLLKWIRTDHRKEQ